MHLVLPGGAAQPGRPCDELVLCDGQPEVTLDLRHLRFVAPLFLVRLRAWLDYHDRAGIRVIVLSPDKVDVCSYMSRMHVSAGLGPNVTFPLPVVNENPSNHRLIAVTRLNADGNDRFDDLFGNLLASPDMKGAGYLAEVVKATASEMMLNAIEHGENPVGAYVAAQRFIRRGDAAPMQCVVAIGDLGIGMAAHLSAGGQGRLTDSATIEHGLADLVSGTGEEFRGRGFVVPFDVASQKNAAWADLRVRANGGYVLKRSSGQVFHLPARTAVTGTWVEFTFAHAQVVG